ncbi:MAG: acyl--CoA ligase [Candidatus Omnitrophica bacterium]|nr:acyl--CoA ligase [Candidatus Omnitrophota bacterium]
MKIVKNIEEYDNFSEILSDAANVFAGKVFIVENKKEYSYEQFNRLVNRCSRMLESDGVCKGDIISIVLKNSLDYLIIYFAALRMGCTINPFPFHLGSEEIKEKIDFIGSRAVYTHAQHADKLKQEGLDVQAIQSDGKMILENRIKNFSDDEYPSEDIDPDATAFMYYSSGTTGSPKIIEYSTRSEILAMASLLRSAFIEPGSCHLCVLPLGHTAAIRYSIWPCLLSGSKVVLYESFWKTRADLWNIVQEHKVTFFEIVPSILIAILNTSYENFNKYDISSLKFIGCGSAYLSKSLQDKFEEKFNIPLANMYGLSETGATHFDNPFEPDRQTGTIGKLIDIMDIRVFDEAGREVETGQSGEFAVKGPSLLKGYYENTAQYEQSFKNGYFLTGDLGYMDEKGIFYYADRKKDLIIKGGVNIVPSQIDETLLLHEYVQDAATIGKPDMFLGEVIKSYVVLKGGLAVGVKELKAHCREHLGDFKVPSEIEFVRELPKGPSGKVLRRKLREKEFTRV